MIKETGQKADKDNDSKTPVSDRIQKDGRNDSEEKNNGPLERSDKARAKRQQKGRRAGFHRF